MDMQKTPAYLPPISHSNDTLLFFIVANKELKKKTLAAAFWKALFRVYTKNIVSTYVACQ